MTTDNWINLIAAIIVGGGTLFLGIMAWRTIRQTRSIQKAEKRERLLNEIIDWARQIQTTGLTTEMPVVDLDSDKDKENIGFFWTANLINRYGSIFTNNEMIPVAWLKLFPKGMRYSYISS